MNYHTKTKRIVIVSSIVLVLILLGVYTYAAAQRGYWPFPAHGPSSQSVTEDTNSIKTSDDPNANDSTYGSVKNESASTDTPDSSNGNTTKKQVGVGIASAGAIENQVEVRAFITEVIEGDGTCTATFTKGSLSVTASSAAFIDVSTSQCKPIDIDLGKFTERGIWSLVVSYSSPTSKGLSSSMEVSL